MSETSITTLWPWKVRELAEREGEDSPFNMLRIDVTRFLSTILLLSTVANVGATAIATEYAMRIWGEVGLGAVTIAMTVVTVLFTEITPKSIAVHNAIPIARAVLQPIAALSVILYPVGRACTLICSGVLALLGLGNHAEPFVTEDELKLIISGAESSGAIEEEEQDMIENVLDLEEKQVKEIMTPLVDVVAVDGGSKLLELLRLWREHQYSRVPVYEGRVDNVVGIAYTMDMLDYLEEPELLEHITVSKAMSRNPAFFVPDSMTVWNLLREFRIRKVHMAVVVNEYGGTAGIVTLEDVVEEIVGEIYDETDTKEEIARKTGSIVRREEGMWQIDAHMSMEDAADALEIEFPEGEYETMAGYIFHTFGYIPRSGESIVVLLPKRIEDKFESATKQALQIRMTVVNGTARKVRSVLLEVLGVCEGTGCEVDVNGLARAEKLADGQPRGYSTDVDDEDNAVYGFEEDGRTADVAMASEIMRNSISLGTLDANSPAMYVPERARSASPSTSGDESPSSGNGRSISPQLLVGKPIARGAAAAQWDALAEERRSEEEYRKEKRREGHNVSQRHRILEEARAAAAAKREAMAQMEAASAGEVVHSNLALPGDAPGANHARTER
eukprot:jgi/Chlat1/684/Chrsp104S01165